MAKEDFDRLVSKIEAQRLREAMRDKLDLADKVQLSKVTGFSEEQLMKDVRYRLSSMLERQGLAQVQYARELIGSFVPRDRSPF